MNLQQSILLTISKDAFKKAIKALHKDPEFMNSFVKAFSPEIAEKDASKLSFLQDFVNDYLNFDNNFQRTNQLWPGQPALITLPYLFKSHEDIEQFGLKNGVDYNAIQKAISSYSENHDIKPIFYTGYGRNTYIDVSGSQGLISTNHDDVLGLQAYINLTKLGHDLEFEYQLGLMDPDIYYDSYREHLTRKIIDRYKLNFDTGFPEFLDNSLQKISEIFYLPQKAFHKAKSMDKSNNIIELL